MLRRFRQLAPWALALGLNLLLFVPGFAFAQPPAPLWRLSFELGAGVLLLGWAARGRGRVAARVAGVVLYTSLLLFLVYQHAFAAFFARPPALIEDWRLALNLLHFLGEMTSARWLAAMVGGLLGAVALVALVERTFAALQNQMAAARPRRLALASGLWLAAGAAGLLWGGPLRFPARALADNYRASLAVRDKLAVIRDAPPDRRNAPLMQVRLARRPSFYLLMIEAYGEILATWDMAEAYRALLARVEARLKAAGYSARSAYSAAPVYGGRSWFSIATVQTGILIDLPESHAALESVGGSIPTLTRFFRAQGYHTMSLQPGTTVRAGLNRLDLYNHAETVDGTGIAYPGPRWGFGGVPDQYSLHAFRERHLAAAPEPRYLFYMAVSTHFPWSYLPPYVADWRSLEKEGAVAAEDPRWPPLPGVDQIASDFRRDYFRSVEYEWRVLTDFLEADQPRDLVVVVLGDHQPRLESNPPGEVTFHSPVHVIARDPAFVDSFAEAGFTPGLYAEPNRRPPLRHEGLFSLWVKKLAEAYGTPETKDKAVYFPDGIGLAGLN